MLHGWRRIAAMLAASSLATIKTLTGLKSDTVLYHDTNNSGIAFSSIRRLSAASQPPRINLVSMLNYYTFWSSYVNQVAHFTLSAVWGMQSTSAYKYSVRLQQCYGPRGLYLEARYKMDFSRWTREKSIIAPSVKKYRVYIPIGGWKRGIIHRTGKKTILAVLDFSGFGF